MLLRLIVGAGLFAAGYYLGREVGRHEPMRREIEQGRADGRSREVVDEGGDGECSAGDSH